MKDNSIWEDENSSDNSSDISPILKYYNLINKRRTLLVSKVVPTAISISLTVKEICKKLL